MTCSFYLYRRTILSYSRNLYLDPLLSLFFKPGILGMFLTSASGLTHAQPRAATARIINEPESLVTRMRHHSRGRHALRLARRRRSNYGVLFIPSAQDTVLASDLPAKRIACVQLCRSPWEGHVRRPGEYSLELKAVLENNCK